jgi:hypothetical protein
MKHILIALLITGLSMGTVYEGMTADGGYQTSDRTEISTMTLDSPVEGGLVEGYGAVDCSTLENPDMPPPTREYVPSIQAIVQQEPLEGPIAVSTPGVDWGYDVLVWGGHAGTGQDFDVDENTGDIYACFDNDLADNDTIYVYRSQDGGYSWSRFGIGTAGAGCYIDNPKIRIVQNGSGNSQVVMMGIWMGSSYSDDLYTRWWDTSGGGGAWQLVDSNVDWADMDADVGSGGYAHCVYMPNDTGQYDINYARNDVTGSGWTLNTGWIVDCQVNPYPSIAAGGGGVVGAAFVDDRQSPLEVRVKMSSDYGSSWQQSLEVSNLGYTPEYPDIAFGRTTPATGWMICQSIGGTDDWCGYWYTTDTGGSWTFGDAFNPGDDENLPNIRARKSTGSVTVTFHGYPDYLTYFTWTTVGDPTGFTAPEQINDFQSTGFWPACAGWNGGSSAILYTNWNNNYRVMFDWYSNTGIEDQTPLNVSMSNFPNPFSAVTNISFSLSQPGPVDITVYDVTGHVVRTLADGQSFGSGTNSVQWDGLDSNGQMATPGVYFCRLSASGVDQTHRMLMIK